MRLPPHLEHELRDQTLILMRCAFADLPRRLALLGVTVGLCWLAGRPGASLWIGVGVLYTELGLYLMRQQMPDPLPDVLHRGDEVPTGTITLFWLTKLISMMLYMLPAVILAGQSSLPLMLCGMVWGLGVLAHSSQTFSAAPLYSASSLAPAYFMIGLVTWAASRQTIAPAPVWHWPLVGITVALFGVTMSRIRAGQRAVISDLQVARAEAQGRLDRLLHLAEHDTLTGLLNRRAFDDRLDAAIARGGTTVFLLDLDGFKPINDSYSHPAGDAVLIAVADRLRAAAGEDAHIARLGGDEFAIALETCRIGGRVEWLTEAILTLIATPIDFGKSVLHLTASIGIADSRRVPGTIETLLSAADQAMYRAKSSGGDRACRFEPADYPARLTLADRARLLDALSDGRIVAHYQPKARLEDGRIVGFEALARWLDAEGAVRPPSEFLPQIHEAGLIAEFTSRIAQQVVTDVAALLEEGLDPGEVSINLPEISLTSLSGRKEILRILDMNPAVTPHLTLEITEDVFIGRAHDVVRSSIAAIRSRGARISLDDFGTGFASFQNLRQLDYDELKIDRSFVSGLGQDHSAHVLIGGFLEIAQGLGVNVVAEGVETADQRAHLLRLGCRLGQGYLFGKAMPIAETQIRLQAAAGGPNQTLQGGGSAIRPPEPMPAPGQTRIAARRP